MLKAIDYVAFAITGRQLHYLVSKKYLEVPTITREEILDKSNADLLAKALALIQTTWFVSQCIGRLAQKLSITLLEVTTLAIVISTLPAFYFWQHKPLCIGVPTVLVPNKTMAVILQEAGDIAQRAFRVTPLDFVEPCMSTTQHICGHPVGRFVRRKWPLERLPNDRDGRTGTRLKLILGLDTLLYCALHVLAWNTSLPTKAERIIWRVSVLVMGTTVGIGGIAEVVAGQFENNMTTFLTTINEYKLRWPHKLMFLIPGAVYFTGRFCMIAVIIASLRSLPISCFRTVRWSTFLPHI